MAGKLTKKITVKAHKFSAKTAKEAIEKAGGAVKLLALMVHKAESAAKAHAGKGVKAPKAARAGSSGATRLKKFCNAPFPSEGVGRSLFGNLIFRGGMT